MSSSTSSPGTTSRLIGLLQLRPKHPNSRSMFSRSTWPVNWSCWRSSRSSASCRADPGRCGDLHSRQRETAVLSQVQQESCVRDPGMAEPRPTC
jgi:hypothetical protein